MLLLCYLVIYLFIFLGKSRGCGMYDCSSVPYFHSSPTITNSLHQQTKRSLLTSTNEQDPPQHKANFTYLSTCYARHLLKGIQLLKNVFKLHKYNIFKYFLFIFVSHIKRITKDTISLCSEVVWDHGSCLLLDNHHT